MQHSQDVITLFKQRRAYLLKQARIISDQLNTAPDTATIRRLTLLAAELSAMANLNRKQENAKSFPPDHAWDDDYDLVVFTLSTPLPPACFDRDPAEAAPAKARGVARRQLLDALLLWHNIPSPDAS